MSRGRSFALCRQTCRRSRSNFVFAFWLLPRAQRRAMEALYAFMRVTDDLADGPGPPDQKRAALADWRRGLDAALADDFRHPVLPALASVVRAHGIPPEYLRDVIDGVEMDLDDRPFRDFDELYRYCYRVASAVGLACIHVWGFRGERAPALAEAVGIGFQLTNILRDLGEDRDRGRVYLPLDDLDRFGSPPHAWDPASGPFRDMMAYQVERARGYYDRGRELEDCLSPPGRAIFGLMWRTYRGLLEAIERRGYDVFSERVRLGKWRKMAMFLGAIPARIGY